jgi:5-formyltetrahydrofolate cyclo-ligase
MNINDNIKIEKNEFRKRLSSLRSSIDATVKTEFDRRIQERVLDLPCVKEAESIFCFLSFGSEVATHELIKGLLACGKRLTVPRILRGQGIHAIPLLKWEDLHPGEWGILTPVAGWKADFAIDLCITPGLGFTTRGDRLGFGRGYYDQWFRENPACYRLAIAYECQVQTYIPTTGRDVRINAIATEQRLIEIP